MSAEALCPVDTSSGSVVVAVPLPTGSAGVGEALSADTATLVREPRFPFPPEPNFNVLESLESAELESVAPWDLLREVTEVDADSLPGTNYEPPSPSHVFTEEQWDYAEFGDERAWYSPVEDELLPAQESVLMPADLEKSGCPAEADDLTADRLEVQLQQQAALDLVKRRRTSLVFLGRDPLRPCMKPSGNVCKPFHRWDFARASRCSENSLPCQTMPQISHGRWPPVSSGFGFLSVMMR